MDARSRALLMHKLNADVTRRRFLQGAAGLAAVTVLGGTSAVSAASKRPAGRTPRSAQAGDEIGGPLNFLGYEGEEAPNVSKAFLEENGIVMQPSYIGAADDALTKFQTGGRGQMDLMASNKDFQRGVLDAGIEFMAPLDMTRIPNAAGLWPAFKVAPWVVRDGVQYTVPLIWGDEPCIYDPAKWPDGPPAKYTDFSDPKWAGELVWLDDPYTNIWLYGKSLGFEDPSRITQAQLDQVVEAMLASKPNVVAYGASLGDMVDIMVRGEASMGIGGWAGQLTIAKEKGKDFAVASPSEDGTFYWSDAYAMALDAPNPANVYAFIDYMMSPEPNAQIAAELGSGCTTEPAWDLLDPDVQELFPYDIVRAEDGGVLYSQQVLPPQNPDGDIVGTAAWTDAWQTFKLS